MSTSERVDSLENALKELAYAGRKTEMSIDRLSEEMREFKAEMAAFKNEMSEFKDEMLAFKNEMSEFKDEMLAFKDEMSGFKGEMSDFKGEMLSYKEENRREARRMNLQWGALANKMGTLVEDMVLPNFPHILERYFGITDDELEDLLVRRRKRHPVDRSRRKEFDLIAWTQDTVFWNETKSNPTIQNLALFVEDTSSLFDYFPELRGMRVVKIASALSMSPEAIAYLTAQHCYAMVLGDETMDLVNFDDISTAA